jgi:hypothetical protein
MDVSTWKGGTLGIRVGSPNAQEHFRKSWKSISVKIGSEFHSFNLSPTFWTTCPEFRGGPIPNWLKQERLDRWQKGSPHTLKLRPLGGNKFELSRK